MMWSESEVTAELWFASLPVWPAVAIGTIAAIARIVTSRVASQPRTAKASTVSAAAATVVMSQARPGSVSTRNLPSCSPNAASALGRAGITLRKVR